MRDPLFASAWLKWGHALEHAQALEDEIDACSEDESRDPLRAFRTEYYAKRHGFGVIVEDVKPLPARWRLLLGDVANNYRASLDHLAWALVTRGRTPPDVLRAKQRNGIYFPIKDDRLQFNGELPIKLPGVRRADIAEVRRRQPYHYSARTRAKHVLTLLAGINSGDKHRTIQPLWSQPTRVNIEVTDARDCEVPRLGWRRNKDALEVDAELAYIGVRKTGKNPELDVKLRVTAEPSIGNRLAFKEWGTRSAVFISRMLVEFSEPPPELVDLGCDLARLQASAAKLHWP